MEYKSKGTYNAIYTHTYIYTHHNICVCIYINLLYYKAHIKGWLKVEFLKTVWEKLNHLEIKGKCFYLENSIISRWFNNLNVKNKITYKNNILGSHFVGEMPKAETV